MNTFEGTNTFPIILFVRKFSPSKTTREKRDPFPFFPHLLKKRKKRNYFRKDQIPFSSSCPWNEIRKLERERERERENGPFPFSSSSAFSIS
jgi:hypothetical protein